jgi:hypothetical protein
MVSEGTLPKWAVNADAGTKFDLTFRVGGARAVRFIRYHIVRNKVFKYEMISNGVGFTLLCDQGGEYRKFANDEP